MPGDALDEALEMLSTKGMLLTQPIPSSVGPYRRELLETRRVLAALVAELEAARAVVEAAAALRDSGYDGPCMGDAVAPLFRAVAQHEAAAKAGKAVE